MTQTTPTSILNNAPRWSHPTGNQVVPSPWQATDALHQPGVNADVLTGQTFFPQLITEPFHSGLVVVFSAAAVMMVIGAIASLFNPGRYGTDPGADNAA